MPEESDNQDKPRGIPVKLNISFSIPTPNVHKAAEDLLAANLACSEELRLRIRVVAKALIDETDEMNLAQKQLRANKPDSTAQLQTLSPPEVVEKAKTLLRINMTNKEHQKKARLVAESYVGTAEHNLAAYETFKRKYGHLFPPKNPPA